MLAMTATYASTYLDAIAHLPSGGTLILTDVTWEEYESLVDDLGDHSSVRLLYDHHLKDDGYVEAPGSLAFPSLTADVLTEFLEQSKTRGQTAALRSFRQWARRTHG
jgi:hypothetical protein